MRKLRISGLIGVLAMMLGVLGLSSALGPAAGASVQPPPTGCTERHGPDATTLTGTWKQQVQVIICYSADRTQRIFTAHLSITPILSAGYKPLNVQVCTAHLQLSHAGGTQYDDKTADCTDRARTAAGGYSIPDRTWTVPVGSGSYKMDGFANIMTGVYYGGGGNPSITPYWTV